MDQTPNFLSISLDFQGFCVVNLVDKQMLVPGDPNLGAVQYKGRYCVFENIANLQKFLKEPGEYFVGVRETCYRSPELIQPLRLHEDFSKSSLYGILLAGETLGKKMNDAPCQTDLHPVPSHIEKEYRWNEWDL